MARQSLILGLAVLLFGVGPFLLHTTAQQRCPGMFNVNFRMSQQTSRQYQNQQRQMQMQFQQQQTQRMQQMQQQFARKVANSPPPATRTAKTTVPQFVAKQPPPVKFTTGKVVAQQPRLNTGLAKAKAFTPKVITSTSTHRPMATKQTISDKTIQRTATIVQPKRQWILPETVQTKTIKKVATPTITAKTTVTPGGSQTHTRRTMSMTMDFKCFQCHRQNNNMLTRQPAPMRHPLAVVRQPINPITRPSALPLPLAIVQPRMPVPIIPIPARTNLTLLTNPIQLASARVNLPAPLQKANFERPASKEQAILDLPRADNRPSLVLFDPVTKPQPPANTVATPQVSPMMRPLADMKPARDEVRSPMNAIEGPALPSLPSGAVVLSQPADDPPQIQEIRLASNTSHPQPTDLTAPDIAPLSSRPFLPLLSK